MGAVVPVRSLVLAACRTVASFSGALVGAPLCTYVLCVILVRIICGGVALVLLCPPPYYRCSLRIMTLTPQWGKAILSAKACFS